MANNNPFESTHSFRFLTRRGLFSRLTDFNWASQIMQIVVVAVRSRDFLALFVHYEVHRRNAHCVKQR